MKKTFSFFLIGVMLFCFPLTALAATDITKGDYASLIYDDGTSNTCIGMFDYKGLSPEEKMFYLECANSISGSVSDKNFQYLVVMNKANGVFKQAVRFYKIPSSSKFGFKTLGSVKDSLTFLPYSSFTQLEFNKNPSTGLLTKSYYSKTVSISSASPHVNNFNPNTWVIIGSSENCAFDSTLTSDISSWINPTHQGALYLVDNNEDKPVPTPTASPTQRPDPTIKPPPSASHPEIPKGDGKYVPYDTSVWEKFLNYVRGNIGSATNIGFLIFAVIFAIYVVIRIIRKFSKG